MTSALLDGLGLSSQFLLLVACAQEKAPMHLVLRAPFEPEEAERAVRDLLERGLCELDDLPGVLRLSPMGYALRDAVAARWPTVHVALRERLLDHLATAHGLAGTRLLDAFRAVDRADFLQPPAHLLADIDAPVPLGVGTQTTSAPQALVAILRSVDVQPGERVLVCGAKAGFCAALVAVLAGEAGHVTVLEPEPELVTRARTALETYPTLAERVEFVRQDDVTVGAEGTFDVAVLNGSVPKIPWPILDGLHPERGRMLAFLQVPGEEVQACYLLRRDGRVEKDETLSQYVFTPLYGRYGWDRLDEVEARYRTT